MKKWQKITLIGCSGCLVLALCVGVAGFTLYRHLYRAECTVPHPSGAPALTFVQKSTHLFLAEYEYKIRFGTGIHAVERWLPDNYGGRTRMNVYWYPSDPTLGHALRLQDQFGEYLVRIEEAKTYRIIRYKGRVFAGELTGSGSDYSIGDKPEISVSVGGNEAKDISGTAVGQGAGEYLGRIDDQGHPLRFVPVSEAPEMTIRIH